MTWLILGLKVDLTLTFFFILFFYLVGIIALAVVGMVFALAILARFLYRRKKTFQNQEVKKNRRHIWAAIRQSDLLTEWVREPEQRIFYLGGELSESVGGEEKKKETSWNPSQQTEHKHFISPLVVLF